MAEERRYTYNEVFDVHGEDVMLIYEKIVEDFNQNHLTRVDNQLVIDLVVALNDGEAAAKLLLDAKAHADQEIMDATEAHFKWLEEN